MITIDGTVFNVPILTGAQIKADMLFKFAERTGDGNLHSQLIGVYFNYSGLKFGTITDTSLYARLWQKITEPVESHSITLYDETGTYTFSAYFANINSALKRVKDGNTYWEGLTMDVIAVSPARIPA
jgi:hypothetical protein